METRKTGSTNNRQDLLAEMLGVMARLRAAEEPSPADAEPRRDAGSKGPAGEEWLSVQAACDYVHVSRTTMYRLVREAKLPRTMPRVPCALKWVISGDANRGTNNRVSPMMVEAIMIAPQTAPSFFPYLRL